MTALKRQAASGKRRVASRRLWLRQMPRNIRRRNDGQPRMRESGGVACDDEIEAGRLRAGDLDVVLEVVP